MSPILSHLEEHSICEWKGIGLIHGQARHNKMNIVVIIPFIYVYK